MKECFQCGEVLAENVKDGVSSYGKIQEAMIVKCIHCGAENRIETYEKETVIATQKAKQGVDVEMTRETMRQNILKALKTFYPGHRGYNGGYLAPVRDPNPDLFMNVLTELENEGLIEYNDTDIALRLSEKYFKEHGEIH